MTRGGEGSASNSAVNAPEAAAKLKFPSMSREACSCGARSQGRTAAFRGKADLVKRTHLLPTLCTARIVAEASARKFQGN